MPLSEAQKAALLERDARVWELRTRDFSSVTAIAEKLGINKGTAARSVARTSGRLAAAMLTDAEAHRAEEVCRLERVLEVTWEDYERTRVDKKGRPKHGSVQVLDRVLRILADLRELWGLIGQHATPIPKSEVNISGSQVNLMTPEVVYGMLGPKAATWVPDLLATGRLSAEDHARLLGLAPLAVEANCQTDEGDALPNGAHEAQESIRPSAAE
jgi:hypothetical protein